MTAAAAVHPILVIPAAMAAPAIKELLDRLIGFREYKRARALDLAARRSRKTIENLLQRLVSTPVGQTLLVKFLRAAEEAGDGEKLLALVGCLSRAADSNDTTAVTIESILVDALSQLEDPHLKLLRMLAEAEQESARVALEAIEEPEEVPQARSPALHESQLAQAVEGYEEVMSALLQTLIRYGLAEAYYPGEGTRAEYRLSGPGQMLLDRLEEVSQLLREEVDDVPGRG